MNPVALSFLVFAIVGLCYLLATRGDNKPAPAKAPDQQPARDYVYIDDNESTPYDPPKVSIDEYYAHFFNVTLPEIRCQAILRAAREEAEVDRKRAEVEAYRESERKNAPLYDEFVRNAKK